MVKALTALVNGIKYVGEWKDNLRDGQGTCTWENSGKYVGQWKDDCVDGQGTCFSPKWRYICWRVESAANSLTRNSHLGKW